MRRSTLPTLLTIAALALATLACNFVTSRIPALAGATATAQAGGPRRTPTAPAGAARPTPTARSGPADAVPGEAPLRLEGGPVIGSARETRVAITEGVAVVDAYALESYTESELAVVGRTYDYTVQLDRNDPVLWAYGWCATTNAILDQNLRNMVLDFSVNDTPVDIRQFHTFDSESGDLVCRFYVAEVYDWPSARTELRTVVTYTELVNDGLSDYPPGTQTFIYNVTVP